MYVEFHSAAFPLADIFDKSKSRFQLYITTNISINVKIGIVFHNAHFIFDLNSVVAVKFGGF